MASIRRFSNHFKKQRLSRSEDPGPSFAWLRGGKQAGMTYINNLPRNFFYLFLYSLLGIVVWYTTPQTGGGRFIMAYLPVLSIVSAGVFCAGCPRWFQKILIGLIFLTIITTIFYRGIANKRYLPVILGRETKAHFLTTHLNFAFGDFYDTDGYFAKHIKKTDRVLLYGMHNLYYVNFPFIDSSWVKRGDKFDYVLVQKGSLPTEFYEWKLIYSNQMTGVRLYSRGK